MRRLVLEVAGYRCQVCNGDEKLNVHHRTYERYPGRERLADLTVLCERCHKKHHEDICPAPIDDVPLTRGLGERRVKKHLSAEEILEYTDLHARVGANDISPDGLRRYGELIKKSIEAEREFLERDNFDLAASADLR